MSDKGFFANHSFSLTAPPESRRLDALAVGAADSSFGGSMPAHIRVCSLTSAVSLVVFVCGLFPGTALAAPSITLSKKIGPPTSKILVSGTGFEPNVGVDIFFDTKDEALVVTDGKGEFHDAKIHAPSSAFPGKHWVTALERNNDKGNQEAFVVNTNWSQFNFGASHGGVNAYENVLNQNTVSGLGLEYTYATGSPIQSSPALVDGILYLAGAESYAGYVYAFDTRRRRLLWTFEAENSVYSSPTVVDGVVYFATDETFSHVHALDALTGQQVWSVQVGGGGISALTVANGMLYFASDELYALDSRTGKVVWSSQVFPFYSPAVANNIVYSGSRGDYGELFALDALTGAILWTFSDPQLLYFGGASVANGVVYAPGGDGNLYAFNAQTGAVIWKTEVYSYEQPCQAVSNGVVYVASFGGPVYAVNASTGAIIWTFQVGETIESSPAVAGGVVYVTALFGKIYALSADNGTVLWEYVIGDYIDSNPIVANGALYVASGVDSKDQGHLWAFGLGGKPATTVQAVQRPSTSTLHPDLTLQPTSSNTTP
jgi:outer membrane protein assembly factor BamB